MSEIIPAILPKDTEDLQHKLAHIPREIPLVHIDVVDEQVFTDPSIDFEVHLMILDPDSVVDEWVSAGASRVIAHKLTDKVRSLRPGIKVGLGVEFDVALKDVYPLLSEVDFVQLMSIGEMGGQGRPFEAGIFDRIRELKENFPDLVVSVDGGVNLENADDLLAVGVDRLVVGSAIFGKADPLDEFIKFLEVVK